MTTVTGIMAKLDVPGRSTVNTGFSVISLPLDFTPGGILYTEDNYGFYADMLSGMFILVRVVD